MDSQVQQMREGGGKEGTSDGWGGMSGSASRANGIHWPGAARLLYLDYGRSDQASNQASAKGLVRDMRLSAG